MQHDLIKKCTAMRLSQLLEDLEDAQYELSSLLFSELEL